MELGWCSHGQHVGYLPSLLPTGFNLYGTTVKIMALQKGVPMFGVSVLHHLV